MSARPLEKLPTIRAKLGSTIVFAVAITIAHLLPDHRLRAPELAAGHRGRSTLLALARRSLGDPSRTPPAGIDRRASYLARASRYVAGEDCGVMPPVFDDGVPHWGVRAAE